jgi:hypothetical protein
MQNTRLNNLINFFIARLRLWLINPWRRVSIWIIGLLFGFFLGTATSTVAGQMAQLDITVAAILLIVVEIINRIVYGRTGGNELGFVNRRAFWIEVLNATKIGFVYSMFVEAFKLGS